MCEPTIVSIFDQIAKYWPIYVTDVGIFQVCTNFETLKDWRLPADQNEK